MRLVGEKQQRTTELYMGLLSPWSHCKYVHNRFDTGSSNQVPRTETFKPDGLRLVIPDSGVCGN